MLYVVMCYRSCAYTNKLVFVCNRCAPETWGAMLQVTSLPELSLLTWETRHCIWRSVSCQGECTFYLPLIKLGVHTFHQSHKEPTEKKSNIATGRCQKLPFYSKTVQNGPWRLWLWPKVLKVQSGVMQPYTFWSVRRSWLLIAVMSGYQPAGKKSY